MQIRQEIEKMLGFKLIRRRNDFNNEGAKDDYILDKLCHIDNISLVDVEKLLIKGLRQKKDLTLLATLGYVYYIKEEFAKCIKCFQRLIYLERLNIDNWLDLAFAYRGYGDIRTSNFIFLNYHRLIKKYYLKRERLTGDVLFEMIRSLEQARIDDRNRITLVNLDENLISRTRPKSAKKTILFINPPIEEPFIKSKKKKIHNKEMIKDTNHYHIESGEIHFKKSYIYNMPIGLLRIANHLLEEGNEILFLDCFASLPPNYPNSKQNIRRIRKEGYETDKWKLEYFHMGLSYKNLRKILTRIDPPDEIFIGCTFTYHNESAHRVIEICKEVFPDSFVRFGGIYPTLAYDHAIKSKADEVFSGEYPGLTNNKINYEILGYNPGYALIKGTKGCPNQCSYCAVHKLEGNKFCHRDAMEVFEEILCAYERFNIREIGIWDSNLLIDYNNYLGIILKEIVKRDIKLRIYAPEGLDYRLINKEIASDLFKAGFDRISLALENIDAHISRNELNRRNSVAKFRESIRLLKEAGFRGSAIDIFVMTGLPGQSLDNVIKNIRYIWSVGCNVTIFPFTPIPSTKLYQEHIAELEKKRLSELHPLCYSMVRDRYILDNLIEISLLNILNQNKESQESNFRKLITDKELGDRLDHFPPPPLE